MRKSIGKLQGPAQSIIPPYLARKVAQAGDYERRTSVMVCCLSGFQEFSPHSPSPTMKLWRQSDG